MTESNASPRPSRRWPAVAVGAVVLLALAGSAGLLYMQHEVDALRQQAAAATEQAQRAVEQAAAAQARAKYAELRSRSAEERARAAESSATEAQTVAARAGDRAADAEQRARREALERHAAERARTEAELDALQAQQAARQAQQTAVRARAEAQRLQRERDAETSRLQAALSEIADTRRTTIGLLMNLDADAINFDFDKADLKAEDRELLSRIAGVLLTTAGYRIQVFGHTDDVGSDEYNLRLSERRAQAVRDYLVRAGLDPAIITTRGFGKSKPLVAGTSEQDRARNRRVELGIIDATVRYSPVPERRQR